MTRRDRSSSEESDDSSNEDSSSISSSATESDDPHDNPAKSSHSISEVEIRWAEYRQAHPVLPLAQSSELRRARRPLSVEISFDHLSGLSSLPNLVKPSSKCLRYSLHVSMYDTVGCRFFGNTWKSDPVQPSNKKTLKLKSCAYFKTNVIDPACLLVIEVACSQYDKNQKLVTKYGCGWTLLPVFASLTDLPEYKSKRRGDLVKADLYSGSPRGLLYLKDKEELVKIKNACLYYASQKPNPKGFERALPLVRENEIVGAGVDPIHGLKTTLGSSSVQLYPKVKLYLNKAIVLLPTNWEETAKKYLLETNGWSEKVSGSFGLRLAPHNGRREVSGQGWTNVQLRAQPYSKSAAYDQILKFVAPVRIGSVVSCPKVAIAFELDYTVQKKSLVVGCGVWFPFTEGSSILLTNTRSSKSKTRLPLELKLTTRNHKPFSNATLFEFSGDEPVLGLAISKKKSKGGRDDDIQSEGSQRSNYGSSEDNESSTDNDSSSSDNAHSISSLSNDDTPRRSPPAHRQLNRKRATQKHYGKHRNSDKGVAMKIPLKEKNVGLKSSLLAASLTLPMHNGVNKQVTHKQDHVASQGGVENDVPQMAKPLTRVARTTLRQNGFTGTQAQITRSVPLKTPGVDIGCELRDKLKVNEFTFQFAAYRLAEGNINAPKPKAVFFSYQFYDFLPTRTERMKLKQHGPVYILTRPKGGPSLGLKYTVDLGKATAEQAEDFVGYMMTKPLTINIWDADSLLLVGACKVELEGLLRCGNKDAALAMEYDVIAPPTSEEAVDVSKSRGSVAGRVQLILNNHGYRSVKTCDTEGTQQDGHVNWRHQPLYNKKLQGLYRVEAKPLSQTDISLRSMLKSRQKKEYRAHSSSESREWTFSPNELGALSHSLDRSSAGKISIKDFLQMVDYGKQKKNADSGIHALSTHLNGDIYKQFLALDVQYDATVDQHDFNKLMKERCGSHFQTKLAIKFLQGKKKVNYEKFLLCVLQDKVSDLESKLSRVLMKAEKLKDVKLSEVFQHHFDENGDGLIQYEELKHGLESLGFAASEEELKTILQRYGDGKTLRYGDFICLAKLPEGIVPRLRKVLLEARHKGLNVEQIFSHFDKDGNGEITATECKDALNEIGLVATEEDVAEVFRKVGKSSSGVIKIAEFLRFIQPEEQGDKSMRSWISANADDVQRRCKEHEDENGYISFDDLVMILHEMKSELSTEEVHADVMGLLDEKKRFDWTKLFAESGENDEEYDLEGILSEIDRALVSAKADGDGVDHIFEVDEDGKVPLSAFSKGLDRLGVEVSGSALTELKARLGFGDNTNVVAKEDLYAELGLSSTHSSLNDFVVGNLSTLRKSLVRMDRKGREVLSMKKVLQALREAGFDVNRDEGAIEDELEELNLVRKDGKIIYSRLVDFFSMKHKICKAYGKANRSGIDVRDFLTRRDRERTGYVETKDLLQILADFGMSLRESHRKSGEEDETASKQLAIVNDLRHDRYIRPMKRQEGDEEELRNRETQLDLVRRYREGQKQTIIADLLKSSLTITKSVHASFGMACFFEIPFENPYGKEETFQLKWKDPELRVITNAEEWQVHRRRQCKEQPESVIPVEHEMITPDTFNLTMAPNEKVSLPFVFQSFHCGLVGYDTSQEKSNSKSITPRTIEVSIVSGSHMHTVRMVNVVVKPRQFNVESEIRLACPKGEVLKTNVRLHNPGQEELFAYSFEHNVVLNWNRRDELSIRFRHDSRRSEFYVLVYNDPFHADLRSILHFFVQEMERVDIHAIAGQRSTKELLLKGDEFSRRVRCYSNCPGEVRFFPTKTFQLIPGAFNKAEFAVCPQLHGGVDCPRQIKVHLVDVDSNELVYAWLVFMTVQRPQVSKTFNVELPLHRACNKKIAYTNPWDMAHTFIIRSSDPLNVRVKQPQLEIAPKTKSFIRLWFKAEHESVERQIELYVNDKNDQNEECICLNLTYI